MIEREIRFKVDEDILKCIIQNTKLVAEKSSYVDLCMGEFGFESLNKKGYIVRIRKNSNGIVLENKKRLNHNKWEEASIKVKNFKEPYEFLINMGLKPYLYINRVREIRECDKAYIYLDEIELIGKYVEFELKEGFYYSDLEEFINKVGIKSKPEKLYGDIFQDKIKDNKFKEKFGKSLNGFIIEN